MDSNQLRTIRLKLDLNQEEIAAKLLMSREHYGLCERGVKPISARTEKLALILLQSCDQ